MTDTLTHTKDDLVRRNRAGLEKFVAGHIDLASRKEPRMAREHLRRQADYLSEQLNSFSTGSAKTPDHLVGVTAFDLANARETLMAAISVVRA